MTNDGSTTSNRTIVWTDPDASGGNPVASITIDSGKAGALISNVSDLTQTTGDADWESGGACTLADHNTVQVAQITDGDGNVETAQFILEVYSLGTTKIAVDNPAWDFCVGDTQLIQGLWLDNNIDRVDISVNGGAADTANHSGISGGLWDYTFSPALGPGVYNVTATIYDLDGVPNTDQVAFTVTICNEVGSDPPTIQFTDTVWNQDLPIGSETAVQGTYLAPEATALLPSSLSMKVFNSVTQVQDTIAGTFVGHDPNSNTQQTWQFSTTNLHLVHDVQTATVEITQNGNMGSDQIPVNVINLDPLQKLAVHPTSTSNTWTFEQNGVEIVPTWSADNSNGGGTTFDAPTGYNAGVLITDTTLVLKLVADATIGTHGSYQANFQISMPAGENLLLQTYHNQILQDDLTFPGPIGTFATEDETNITIDGIDLDDGEVMEFHFTTQLEPDPADQAYWTFSNVQFTPSTFTPEPGVYVDSNLGDDNNPGTFDSPKATIQAGVDSATAGQTVWIARGTTYNEQVLVDLKIGVTLSGTGYRTGPKPVLDGEKTLPLGALTNADIGLLELRNTINCTVTDLEVINSRYAGITVRDDQGDIGDQQSSNNTITNCGIRFARNWGFIATGDNHDATRNGQTITPGQVLDVEISDCEVEGNCTAVNEVGGSPPGGESITIDGADVALISDNDVFGYNKEGIAVYQNATNVVAQRNRVRDRNPNTSYGLGQGAGMFVSGASGVTFDRNWVSDDANGIVISDETGLDVANVVVVNNLIEKNHTNQLGLHGDSGSSGPPGDFTNVACYNNTLIAKPGQEAQYVINVRDPEGSIADLTCSGNIIYRAAGNALAMINDRGVLTADNNLFYNGGDTVNGFKGTNSIVGDPLFEPKAFSAWPWTTEYYIGASSPAKDIIADGGEYAANDLANDSRPEPILGSSDLGCFERTPG